jgi:hypothetical protein
MLEQPPIRRYTPEATSFELHRARMQNALLRLRSGRERLQRSTTILEEYRADIRDNGARISRMLNRLGIVLGAREVRADIGIANAQIHGATKSLEELGINGDKEI